MDEITEEFYSLKLALSPVLAFLDEIKGIRRARRISEESSITLLGLLTLEIKEDVITSVRALQIEEEKRMADIEETIRDTQKEMRDKFYDYTQNLTNLEMDLHNLGDLIARQGSFLENQNKHIDGIKKDMSEKAASKEVMEFKKQLKRYTPLGDFNALSNQVLDLATKSTVDIIRKELHNLEKRVKIYITSEEMNEAVIRSEANMKKHMHEKYVNWNVFEEEKSFNIRRMDRMEDDIKFLFQKIDQVNEAFKKKVKDIFETINKKPWKNDFEVLQMQIDESATKKEFLDLTNYINPKIDSFSYTVTESMIKVTQFEKILERYDEIILDKASKDDIKMINSRLPLLTTVSSHNELSKCFEDEVEVNKEKYKQISVKSEELFFMFNTLSAKLDAIRKDNIEVAAISSTLATFTEKLTEKADKSDIYLIYDVMGRKEDINTMKEFSEIDRKQLETCVVIVQSLCRTMLKGGESPAVTRKQRFDLYRNLSNLLGWINGEEQREPQMMPSNKSPVNLKTDFDLETYSDLLASARLTRRYRRNVMTTSPKNKTSYDFVNLPPLS